MVQKLDEYNILLRRLLVKHRSVDLHEILTRTGMEDVGKQVKDFFTAVERYAKDIDVAIEAFTQAIAGKTTAAKVKDDTLYNLTFSSLHHPTGIIDTFRKTVVHDVDVLRTLVKQEEHLEIILAKEQYSEEEWAVVIAQTLSLS